MASEAEPEVEGRRHPSVDRGYAWVVLTASVLLNILVEGAFSGMSVLVVELKYHFDAPESAIIGIGGILLSIGFIFSFLVGWFVKRFGCRRVGILSSIIVCGSLIAASFAKTIVHLYITYGAMLGLSITCYFNISSIAVQQYFEKRRALAQGILMAALSVGTFLWPPVMRLLMDFFGWRGALMLVAGIELHGVALSMLLRPLPAWAVVKPTIDAEAEAEKEEGEDEVFLEDNQKTNTKKGSCFKALFKILLIFPHYCLYILAIIMTQSGNVLPYTLVPALADSYGIDKHRQALLVSIGAASSGVGRVLAGYVGDHPKVNRILMCAISGVVAGVLTTFTALMNTFVSLAITFAVIGVPSASLMSGYASAAVDIVGKKYVQQGVGLMSVAFGFAHLLAFLVNGKLTDYEGGISIGFFAFGVIEAVGGIIFFICFIIDRRIKQRKAKRLEAQGTNNDTRKTTST